MALVSRYIEIDGTTYAVPIVSLKRRADILDKYAYRSEDGVLHREVIGTYHNFTLQIGTIDDADLYETLFDVLSAPVEYHTVSLPHDSVSFKGYFSSVQDEVHRLTEDGATYRGLSCNLTAMKPRRTS